MLNFSAIHQHYQLIVVKALIKNSHKAVNTMAILDDSKTTLGRNILIPVVTKIKYVARPSVIK